MFAVERFGVPIKDTTQADQSLSSILQKSRERLKRKQAEALVQSQSSAVSEQQKKKTSHSQPQNITVLLETTEEKLARKALAKAEKKERKEKLREAQEKERQSERPTEKQTEKQPEREKQIKNEDSISLRSQEDREDDHQNDNSMIEKNETTEEISTTTTKSQQSKTNVPINYTPLSMPNQPKKESITTAPINAWISSAVAITERVCVEESIQKWGVDKKLAADLLEDNVKEYFPVQIAVIPLLLSHLTHQPFAPPRDMIVSAPTGSGKTLAYALPIIQALSHNLSVTSTGLSEERKKRMPRKLQALIILPSRELVTQVYQVFCRLGRNTSLRIGQASGHVEFHLESSMLVDQSLGLGPYSLSSHSLVDILICTPGRLLDHLQSTPYFSLAHLKYLVFDEADRLLSNAYDHWVRSLMASTNSLSSPFVSTTTPSSTSTSCSLSPSSSYLRYSGGEYLSPIAGPSHSSHIQRLMFSATLTDNPRKLSLSGVKNPLIIRTNTTSSSTSTDVENSNEVQTGGDEYVLPSHLTEWLCLCETSTRPLYLLSLLYQVLGLSPSLSSHYLPGLCSRPEDIILIFTSSVETTHRLARLLQVYNGQLDHRLNSNSSSTLLFGGEVREISRLIPSRERSEILSRAKGIDTDDDDRKDGDESVTHCYPVKILISSDHLSRGIDLRNIRLVINYDPPSHPRTYVHRVGRTARAERDGDSITMIKKGNYSQFRELRKKINQKEDKEMKKVKIAWRRNIDQEGERVIDEEENDAIMRTEYEKIVQRYQVALGGLSQILQMESEQEIAIGEC